MIVDTRAPEGKTTYSVKQAAAILHVSYHSVLYILEHSVRYGAWRDTLTKKIQVTIETIQTMMDDKKAGMVLKNAERVA